MNRVLFATIAKNVTRFCVDRTSSAALRTMTAYAGVDILPMAPRVGKVVRFIGVEATSIAIMKAVGGVVDEVIDDAADKLADACIAVKEVLEERGKNGRN